VLDMTQKVENNKEKHVPGSSAAPPKICQTLKEMTCAHLDPRRRL
jgi:hypothetical protein